VRVLQGQLKALAGAYGTMQAPARARTGCSRCSTPSPRWWIGRGRRCSERCAARWCWRT
jgi:hypothetical protein